MKTYPYKCEAPDCNMRFESKEELFFHYGDHEDSSIEESAITISWSR